MKSKTHRTEIRAVWCATKCGNKLKEIDVNKEIVEKARCVLQNRLRSLYSPGNITETLELYASIFQEEDFETIKRMVVEDINHKSHELVEQLKLISVTKKGE